MPGCNHRTGVARRQFVTRSREPTRSSSSRPSRLLVSPARSSVNLAPMRRAFYSRAARFKVRLHLKISFFSRRTSTPRRPCLLCRLPVPSHRLSPRAGRSRGGSSFAARASPSRCPSSSRCCRPSPGPRSPRRRSRRGRSPAGCSVFATISACSAISSSRRGRGGTIRCLRIFSAWQRIAEISPCSAASRTPTSTADTPPTSVFSPPRRIREAARSATRFRSTSTSPSASERSRAFPRSPSASTPARDRFRGPAPASRFLRRTRPRRCSSSSSCKAHPRRSKRRCAGSTPGAASSTRSQARRRNFNGA